MLVKEPMALGDVSASWRRRFLRRRLRWVLGGEGALCAEKNARRRPKGLADAAVGEKVAMGTTPGRRKGGPAPIPQPAVADRSRKIVASSVSRRYRSDTGGPASFTQTFSLDANCWSMRCTAVKIVL